MATKRKAGRTFVTVHNPSKAGALTIVNPRRGTSQRKNSSRARSASSRARSNPSTALMRVNPSRIQVIQPRANPSRRRKSARRGFGRFRLNPDVGDIGRLLKAAFLGSVGAFTTNTVAQLIPVNFGGAWGAVGKKAIVAIAVGMAGSKLFGRASGELITGGGLIAVSIDAINLLFPQLKDGPVFTLPGFLGGGTVNPARVPAGTNISGLVDYMPDGQPYMKVNESELSGLVGIPEDSPAYQPSGYYYN